MSSQSAARFTKITSKELLCLEEELAFFFNAKDPERIQYHYIAALKALENDALCQEVRKREILENLAQAYAEVAHQTSLAFDPAKAAELEYALISAQRQQASFESMAEIMRDLYAVVYGTRSLHLEKAALLRTFLYLYKIRLINAEEGLLESDVSLLKVIDKASKTELSCGSSDE
ncbi:hypothetical protein Bealeia1_01107 [Candidatus Bealeia paramacronuclearis]|uniref:Uncharacterized protein n=1 Tax=Candidatus Bealeia paramacronuclearis TaxID=1921001 RepID=A0ABZ2C388_9PROT|nr:hypothetical protein [Candidatus Bealeia paramacronuclearis]